MKNRFRRLLLPLAVLCSFALVAAACGDDDDDSSSPSGGDGSVNISGSSTVQPISEKVAELAEDAGLAMQVTVNGPGTGDGFAVFCEGETDISDASRPIKDEEAEICAANGIEFVELNASWWPGCGRRCAGCRPTMVLPR